MSTTLSNEKLLHCPIIAVGLLPVCVSMTECFVALLVLCSEFGPLIWQPACPRVWLLIQIALCCFATEHHSVLF